jgi:hypothetical protein
MRVYLYILAGITSAIVGWNLGQFVLTDLGNFLIKFVPGLEIIKQYKEIILFPAIAMTLAAGMVINEIFLSNPTRPRLNWRIAKLSGAIAAGIGFLVGALAGILAAIMFTPSFGIPELAVRVVGWIFIGIAVGLAEGLTWRWRSVEAGDPSRFYKRLTISTLAGAIASFIAALIFEFFREGLDQNWAAIEDPLGFAMLGCLLGVAFSITTSPSYLAALRAGAGFEYGINPFFSGPDAIPIIKKNGSANQLKFVSDSISEDIQEGFSIQLPSNAKIKIGSDPASDIYLPGIPEEAAVLEVKLREVSLIPNKFNYDKIAIREVKLNSARSVVLKHNYSVSLYSLDSSKSNGKEFFRFVYYNRFLDPQS